MKPLLLLIAFLTISGGPKAFAQTDSITARPAFPTVSVAVPAATAATMLAVSRIYPHGNFVSLSPGEHTSRGTGVLQYAPIALPWVMKAAGVRTRSSWGRMAVSEGCGVVLNAALVWTIKGVIHSPRPDGTDARSFPSGHSAWAFAGASMVERELGPASSWYTWGAYAFASTIAMERVIDAHHYPTDVIAGASIGVLATHAGYYIADLIMGRRGIERRYAQVEGSYDITPGVYLENMLRMPLGPVTMGEGINIERRPALITAAGYEHPVSRAISLAAGVEVESMPVSIVTPAERFISGPLTSAGLTATASMYFPVSERLKFAGSTTVGWMARFKLHSPDDAISAGGTSLLMRLKGSAQWVVAPHLSVAPAVGLQISGYRYSASPSTTLSIIDRHAKRGTAVSLLLSVATRYEF